MKMNNVKRALLLTTLFSQFIYAETFNLSFESHYTSAGRNVFNVENDLKGLLQEKPNLTRTSSLATVYARSGDYGAGNGGDSCERRIKEIRDDLKSWILRDGHKGLDLFERLRHEQYKTRMLNSIDDALVYCTNKEIMVGSSSKTCKNTVHSSGTPILACNIERFDLDNEDEQYRLIHHEYAGLSGLEINSNTGTHYEESDYSISNQISSFLQVHEVKRLVIKPSSKSIICGYRFGWFEAEYSDDALSLEVSEYDRDYFNRDHNTILGQQKNIDSKVVVIDALEMNSLGEEELTATLAIEGNPTVTVKKTQHEIILDSSDKDVLDAIVATLGLGRASYRCQVGLD